MLLWLLTLGCKQVEPVRSSKPQFLIFLVNGLRSDADGKQLAEASLINAIGRQPNRHFSAAYVSSPSKPISFASLLTGDYPSAIPVCGRPGQDKSRHKLWCSEIPDSRRTMPEVFQIYGYQTCQMVNGRCATHQRLVVFKTRIE
jgi:arylsulfatase A-like enzyme